LVSTVAVATVQHLVVAVQAQVAQAVHQLQVQEFHTHLQAQ
jgi:hypothetical protein